MLAQHTRRDLRLQNVGKFYQLLGIISWRQIVCSLRNLKTSYFWLLLIVHGTVRRLNEGILCNNWLNLNEKLLFYPII